MKKTLLLLLACWCLWIPLSWGGQRYNSDTGKKDFTGLDIQTTDCSTYTTEGLLCWDTDNDTFCIGTGAACTTIGSTGDITDVNEGTAIDVTTPTGPAPTVSWDSTEVEATTWGAGGNASNIWTFNVSGTDPTLTAGSAAFTISHDLLMNDNRIIGLGTSSGLIEFDDQTNDEVNILNARVGIGTQTPGLSLVAIAGSYSGAGTTQGLSIEASVADPGAGGEYLPLVVTATLTGTVGSTDFNGGEFRVTQNNTGTVPNYSGIRVDRSASASANTSERGIWLNTANGNAVKTTTTDYGIDLEHIMSGTKTATTSYNLYMANSAPGINVGTSYNLYQAGTEDNVFGGPIRTGTAGVRLTGDGDGALTFLGEGNGSDEDLTMNLDDTANTTVLSSSTGVTSITLTSMGITSTATGSIGWSVVATANQACNTTCTNACVFGQDTATIVDCADATADRCVCAGAN